MINSKIKNSIKKIPYLKRILKSMYYFSRSVKTSLFKTVYHLRGFEVRKSWSQQLEDVYIFNQLQIPIPTSNKDYWLVEVGALDGITYSNTLMFENEFGLRCLLIEPDPVNFRKLEKNRIKSVCVECAIAPTSGEELFLGGGNAVGGIKNTVSERHKDRFKESLTNEFKVKTNPLSKITKELGIQNIYLLSIDCEGGDLGVIKSIDFDSVDIEIIIVETGENEESISQFLTSKGFIQDRKLFGNQIWRTNNSSLSSFNNIKPNKNRNLAWEWKFMEGHLRKEAKKISKTLNYNNHFF